MNRRGFALITVLWLVTVLSVTVGAGMLAARNSVALSGKRMARLRTAWLLEGCAAWMMDRVDRMLQQGTPWGALGDSVGIVHGSGPRCDFRFMAAGIRLDVNSASGERIARLLVASDVAPIRADSLAAALLDWRDPDDVARDEGAEAGWYEAHHRARPRNANLASPAELGLVRGFETVGPALEWLDTEPGRTPVNLAPAPVLASLPGFTGELAARVMELRRRGRPIANLAELLDLVVGSARQHLELRFAELSADAVIDPEAWILEVRLAEAIRAGLRLRLVPGSEHVIVARRLPW